MPAQDPVESRMAPLIKREMDKRYSPTWHVFIGKVRCARPLPARALLIAGSAPSRCIPAIVDAGGRARRTLGRT